MSEKEKAYELLKEGMGKPHSANQFKKDVARYIKDWEIGRRLRFSNFMKEKGKTEAYQLTQNELEEYRKQEDEIKFVIEKLIGLSTDLRVIEIIEDPESSEKDVRWAKTRAWIRKVATRFNVGFSQDMDVKASMTKILQELPDPEGKVHTVGEFALIVEKENLRVASVND